VRFPEQLFFLLADVPAFVQIAVGADFEAATGNLLDDSGITLCVIL